MLLSGAQVSNPDCMLVQNSVQINSTVSSFQILGRCNVSMNFSISRFFKFHTLHSFCTILSGVNSKTASISL